MFASQDPIGAEWYAENVKDFLDSPNEFYYEPETQKLYIFSNTSGPPTGIFVATQLQVISFHLRSTIRLNVLYLTTW